MSNYSSVLHRTTMALPVLYLIQLSLLFALLFFLPISLLRRRRRRTKGAIKNLPPSPPRIPIFGNLHQLGNLPHRSLAALSASHGPLMLLHLGHAPTLVVSSASIARDITKTHDHVFASRPSFKAAETILYGSTSMAFAPLGDHWRNVRKLCMTHLLNTKMVQSFRPIREEEVALMIQKISCAAEGGLIVDMSTVLNTFTNDHLCRVVWGKFDSEGRNEQLKGLKRELSALLGAFYVGDYIPYLGWMDVLSGMDGRGKRNRRGWDDVLDEIIEEHADRKKTTKEKERGDQDLDFVDVLLSLQKDPSLGFQLTTDNIKVLLVDMIFAGTDTTYIFLEWAMSELVRNCEVMKKLKDEIREIIGGKDQVWEADLGDMIYLKCVIKEVLRLHPPTPLLVQRESMKDCDIQGYMVPNKTRVIINAWAVNRDSKFWEVPDEFCPERFIGSSIDFKGNDFLFIPFGAGRRICPGMIFASAITELALANLVNQFEWKLPNDLTRENFDMTEAPGITVSRKHKLELLVKAHSF